MQYIEKYADLFDIDDPDVWFVQCISADLLAEKVSLLNSIKDLIRSRNCRKTTGQMYGTVKDTAL